MTNELNMNTLKVFTAQVTFNVSRTSIPWQDTWEWDIPSEPSECESDFVPESVRFDTDHIEIIVYHITDVVSEKPTPVSSTESSPRSCMKQNDYQPPPLVLIEDEDLEMITFSNTVANKLGE